MEQNLMEMAVVIAVAAIAAAAVGAALVRARRRSAASAHDRHASTRRQADERAMRRERLIGRFRGWLIEDYLQALPRLAADPDAAYLSLGDARAVRAVFVAEWAKTTLGETLSLEQAAAVGCVDGNVKVTARAGSGKTRTLVVRTAFLMRHCRVAPEEVLLLAFNKRAAEEMRDRLKVLLPNGSRLPHVMTFHALAHALVRPTESIIGADRDEESDRGSRELQAVIDDLLASPLWRHEVRSLMASLFREDPEELFAEQVGDDRATYLAYRRGLRVLTLGGDRVKSFGEKVIANALFEHDVPLGQIERVPPKSSTAI